MEAIVRNIPLIEKNTYENTRFFFVLLKTITASKAIDLQDLAKELDLFFGDYGKDNLPRIVFMYGYSADGLVIVTKFDYIEVILVKGDTSFILNEDE